jgi:hypothetical protein
MTAKSSWTPINEDYREKWQLDQRGRQSLEEQFHGGRCLTFQLRNGG